MRRTLFALIFVAAGAAWAQTTYRWIDPSTGNIIYSDKPPPTSIKGVEKQSAENPGEERQQPYALRRAAEKFPVTLYTAANCGESCQQARTLLGGRGIPFQEKIVISPSAEFDELKAMLGGEPAVPVLVVGRQHVRGFESGAWNNMLDLAGYPTATGLGDSPAGTAAR